MEEGGHCLENNFKLSVKSNPGLLWFCFVSLCDWSRKLVPLSQPIRFKTKTNESWSFVFFTFQIVYLFYFGFSMAPFHIFLTSEWLSWLLWLWCENTPLKCILWSLCLLNWLNKCRLRVKGGGISIVRITVLNCLAHYIKYVTIKLLMMFFILKPLQNCPFL